MSLNYFALLCREHFCLFMFTFGFAFAKISCQMVVAMMSKSPFPLTGTHKNEMGVSK